VRESAFARFGLFLREMQISLSNQDIPTHSFISSQTLGIGLVIVGIIIIILAVWRYNQVFWQIEQGNYQPNRLMVWLTATIVILLGLLSIPFFSGGKPLLLALPLPVVVELSANLESFSLPRSVGHTGTLNASGENDLCQGEAIPQGKPTRRKRKPKK
jgi:putative membrane protein